RNGEAITVSYRVPVVFRIDRPGGECGRIDRQSIELTYKQRCGCGGTRPGSVDDPLVIREIHDLRSGGNIQACSELARVVVITSPAAAQHGLARAKQVI